MTIGTKMAMPCRQHRIITRNILDGYEGFDRAFAFNAVILLDHGLIEADGEVDVMRLHGTHNAATAVGYGQATEHGVVNAFFSRCAIYAAALTPNEIGDVHHDH